MAYNVYFSCDKCGNTYNWINKSVSMSRAIKLARRKGWCIGKNGWFCSECRNNKKKNKRVI